MADELIQEALIHLKKREYPEGIKILNDVLLYLNNKPFVINEFDDFKSVGDNSQLDMSNMNQP